jgi:hypothetical protein
MNIKQPDRSSYNHLRPHIDPERKAKEENIDSKADGKTSIPVDASRQNQTKQAVPGQSKKA